MKPTLFTKRLGDVLLYIEREMEGETDYETIIREVEERLERLRIEALGARTNKPAPVSFTRVPRHTIEDAAEWAASYFGFSLERLRVPSRCANRTAYVRHVVMWFLRTRIQAPIAQIGKTLNRHHSSVLHGYERIEKDRKGSVEIKDDTDAMMAAYDCAMVRENVLDTPALAG